MEDLSELYPELVNGIRRGDTVRLPDGEVGEVYDFSMDYKDAIVQVGDRFWEVPIKTLKKEVG